MICKEDLRILQAVAAKQHNDRLDWLNYSRDEAILLRDLNNGAYNVGQEGKQLLYVWGRVEEMQYNVYLYNALVDTIRVPEADCDYKWVNDANELGIDCDKDQWSVVAKKKP